MEKDHSLAPSAVGWSVLYVVTGRGMVSEQGVGAQRSVVTLFLTDVKGEAPRGLRGVPLPDGGEPPGCSPAPSGKARSGASWLPGLLVQPRAWGDRVCGYRLPRSARCGAGRDFGGCLALGQRELWRPAGGAESERGVAPGCLFGEGACGRVAGSLPTGEACASLWRYGYVGVALRGRGDLPGCQSHSQVNGCSSAPAGRSGVRSEPRSVGGALRGRGRSLYVRVECGVFVV